MRDGMSRVARLGVEMLEGGHDGLDVVEACNIFYPGGSASTPALRQDGSRVYFGDNEGKLLAVDAECQLLWSLDIGSQIVRVHRERG